MVDRKGNLIRQVLLVSFWCMILDIREIHWQADQPLVSIIRKRCTRGCQPSSSTDKSATGPGLDSTSPAFSRRARIIEVSSLLSLDDFSTIPNALVFTKSWKSGHWWSKADEAINGFKSHLRPLNLYVTYTKTVNVTTGLVVRLYALKAMFAEGKRFSADTPGGTTF